MKELDQIKGWLIDLDGTVHIGDALLPGAAELVAWLRSNRKPYRFISGTSTRSRTRIARHMTELGISMEPDEIFTASSAVAELLRSFTGMKCYLQVADDVMTEFDGLDISDTNPDYVVIGDIGKRINYDLINKAFQLVMGGAELIALEKGRFFRDANGLQLGAGAFVAALEYASGKQAKIIGKPSRQFFNLAVHDMRVEAGQRWLSADFAMVGDDIESDIRGAAGAGLMGILVKTGRHNDSYSEHYGIVPDWTFDSVKDLAERLK